MMEWMFITIVVTWKWFASGKWYNPGRALTVCIPNRQKHGRDQIDIQLIVIAIELRHIFACDVNLDAFIINNTDMVAEH